MKTFKSLLKEITESIEISDDIVSVDGKDRFILQPAEGHKLKSDGGRAYKYWTIYDIERKKDRKNPAIGVMNKNQAIAYVKKLIKIEKDDPDHPKNMRIVKMHKDDTDTGKHRWDIRTNKGEGDIVDSYGSRTDAHHYLTKFRKEKTNTVNEDLRKWFSKTDPEGGWKRINSKGEAIGPCAREPGEPKPKCMSNAKRASLSKKERASAVSAKRKYDPDPERKGPPINVSNFGKGKISEDMENLNEKNVPTSPEKWAQAKSQAKSKFDVYPSAYANGWAAKKYKDMGGGWRSVSEETERLSFKDFIAERCWPGYKEVKGKKAFAPGSCVKESAAAAIAAATAIAKKKSGNYDEKGFRKTPYKNPDSPNIKTNAERKKEMEESAAWQRKEGKNPEGGLNRKGIESYRRENPGSKLSMAVTTPPSKLKPGSKAANRRKSFCARMGGMEGPMKKPNGEPTRKALALRKWNC